MNPSAPPRRLAMPTKIAAPHRYQHMGAQSGGTLAVLTFEADQAALRLPCRSCRVKRGCDLLTLLFKGTVLVKVAVALLLRLLARCALNLRALWV